jgi:hypothetical protein
MAENGLIQDLGDVGGHHGEGIDSVEEVRGLKEVRGAGASVAEHVQCLELVGGVPRERQFGAGSGGRRWSEAR